MKAEFQTLALVGRIDDPRIAESMHTIAAHAAQRGARVLVDERLAVVPGSTALRVPEDQLAAQADLLVAVGDTRLARDGAQHDRLTGEAEEVLQR